MAQKISMQQIADRLGVSKYTVSQALSGKPGVSEATRREVTAMAAALGYRIQSRGPAASGSGAESNASSGPKEAAETILIGLNGLHAEEPLFWRRVKEGIDAGCKEFGLIPHYFILDKIGEKASSLGELVGFPLAETKGFIIAGKCPVALLLRLKRTGLPMVLVDHEETVAGADAVLNDNVEAGRMACSQLATQGCKSIVFVGHDRFAVSFRERFWGCRIALDDYNGQGRRKLIPTGLKHAASPTGAGTPIQLKKWTIPYGASSSWKQSLKRRIGAAIESLDLPDGMICANDDIALELLDLLRLYGVGFPGQCRVLGIDNTAASLKAAVPLTTIDLAKERLGMRAVETFVRRCRYPEAPYEKVILSAKLIVRYSG
ncbi:LacI family DNA-binding transcriptional regulator [Paenibacillus nasutitermitis]|uniref:Transcriptional regulator n=1 Tax=Paenibacillus nasutitermitis TaxID=1652958 RepID=A0A916Z1S1_9BACL|nr:LacI family DNA-binding transcriptional regulator [Paenibacillus nasutitermitis]GGD71932.1 transcriptional regulator [Paenibacillus nasutitermitis]